MQMSDQTFTRKIDFNVTRFMRKMKCLHERKYDSSISSIVRGYVSRAVTFPPTRYTHRLLQEHACKGKTKTKE